MAYGCVQLTSAIYQTFKNVSHKSLEFPNQNLPSDDLQNPDPVTSAKNPDVDTSEMGSCSSGPNVQEARGHYPVLPVKEEAV